MTVADETGNVIDSLVVKLTIDNEQFERGRKSSEDNLEKTRKKFGDETTKIDDHLTKVTKGFQGVAKSVLELYGVFLTTGAIKNFTEDVTRTNAGLSRLGENLRTAPSQFYAWGAAAERLGGSTDATVQSFQVLGDKIQAFKTQGQQLPLAFYQIQALGGKQIDLNHGVAQSFADIAEDLHRIYAVDPQKADFLGRQLGIDSGTVNLMERYGAGLKNITEDVSKLAPSPEALQRSKDLQESWAKLATEADSFGRSLVDKITPALIRASDETRKFLEEVSNEGKKTPQQKAMDFSLKPAATLGFTIAKWLGFLPGKTEPALPSTPITSATRGAHDYLNAPDLQGIGNEVGKDTLVNGSPVSRANPMPVTIADAAGGGGGNDGGGGVFGSIRRFLFGGGSSSAYASTGPSGSAPASTPTQQFSYDPPPAGAPSTLTDLISQEALKAAGGDAAKATAIRQRMEGIRNGESIKASDSRYDVNLSGGDRSYGPFQLNKIAPGALGSVFEQETANERKRMGIGGLEDPRTIPLQTQWVAKYLARGRSVEENLGPWGGPNWASHAPREADPRWKNTGYDPGIMNIYQSNSPVTPFFGRNPGGRWSAWAPAGDWASDWGDTSAAARAALAGSNSVTNTSNSHEINIGHIDLHTNMNSGAGAAMDFMNALKLQTEAQSSNYGPT
jgi:hypothetical protein